MIRYFLAVMFLFVYECSNAQNAPISNIEWEQLGKILPSADSLFIHTVQAKVGDTVTIAYQSNKPLLAVVKSNQSVNHAVTNIHLELISVKDAKLFIAFRRDLPRGKGFIGRMNKNSSKEIYTIQFNEREGYYFEKNLKSTVITN